MQCKLWTKNKHEQSPTSTWSSKRTGNRPVILPHLGEKQNPKNSLTILHQDNYCHVKHQVDRKDHRFHMHLAGYEKSAWEESVERSCQTLERKLPRALCTLQFHLEITNSNVKCFNFLVQRQCNFSPQTSLFWNPLWWDERTPTHCLHSILI